MPRLLLTRSEEDSAGLAASLSDMGVTSLIAPLLRVENVPGPALNLDNTQGILLTSANGARAMAMRTARRDVPVYAVGDATARTASDLGFTDISSARGDVDDLAVLVRERCNPDYGELFHAAGSVIAGDLAAMLAPFGFEIRREMLYEAKTPDALPAAAARALEDGILDGIVLYSPRTARTFDVLVEKAGLTDALAGLRLFALSKNVDAATTSRWAERIVAGHPDQESLLHAVRACYY
tara:strand:- start:16406 stop:17119 length:714 start_codon:yes stop_codon:yes gene_type:complete